MPHLGQRQRHLHQGHLAARAGEGHVGVTGDDVHPHPLAPGGVGLIPRIHQGSAEQRIHTRPLRNELRPLRDFKFRLVTGTTNTPRSD